MNSVLQFLKANWKRIGLESFAPTSNLSYYIATPRFRASSHVIFFIMIDEVPDPFLVVKVPRLPGDNESLDREASNLRKIHGCRNGGFDSVPRVVAYEQFQGSKLLVETALAGQAMSSPLVRKNHKNFTAAVISWLIEFHLTTKQAGTNDKNWFDRLVGLPLDQFIQAIPISGEENHMLEVTRELTSVLRHKDIPLVFEHRDLGPPNILLYKDGCIGVVDWELAEAEGLPALDLFFFLTLTMFAARRARKKTDYLAAFQEAFFDRDAWAKPYINHYAEQLNLSCETLNPLFILCWYRYVLNIVNRIRRSEQTQDFLSDEALSWLRSNRYYILWRHAVQHVSMLNLID